jgi:hypothetical protein
MTVVRIITVILLAAGSASALAQRALVLDRLPFEVTIDIVWQGRDLQIRKILSCDLRRRDHPGNIQSHDYGLKLREVWEQNTNRISHRLPSNELLVFLFPGNACNQFNKWLNPIPLDFLPITYWLNDANKPSEAEHIRSHRYFEANPKRKFAVRSFRISAVKPDTQIEDEQFGVDQFQSRKRADAYFGGVNAVVIPKTEWGRFPQLAEALVKLKTTVEVDRNLVNATAPALLAFCDADNQGIRTTEKCRSGPFDDRPHAVAGWFDGTAWRLDYMDIGVRRFSRYIEASEVDRTGCGPTAPTCNLRAGTYRLVVAEREFYLPKLSGSLIFDAREQVLVRVGFGLVPSSKGESTK